MIANFLVLLFLVVEAIAPQTEQLVGGLKDQPVSSPGVQKVARFAVEAYNKAADSLFYSQEVKLIRAQTQVVQGIKYILTMELADTQCQKSLPSNDLEHCQIPPGAKHLECVFSVWSRPWINPPNKLMSFDCKPIVEQYWT